LSWSGTGDEPGYTGDDHGDQRRHSTATVSFDVTFTDVAATVAADQSVYATGEHGTFSDYDDAS